ncbi:MAG: dTDP-4-dehydrorhamnose reductase [Chitinispirillaceae bacterium]|nr:dTDP-4-dehydrorhamnose reductase [Chitinispirillaceae bacterium]
MKSKTYMVIGSTGQLGTDMCDELRLAGFDVHGVDYPDIDIGNERSVASVVDALKPATIINCAAFTAVDDCETQRERAFLLNAEGAGYLAAAAGGCEARIVHISTDYVFDGCKDGFYLETDQTNPQTVYGRSKLEGERLVAAACENHQIFRIAWLYGIHGKNFVYAIRAAADKKAAAGEPLRVVADQFGTPTSTREVCRQVLRAQAISATGVFHATCEGDCSWFDFAGTIVTAAGIPVEVLPCTTEEFPRPAPRPRNSRLENRRLKEERIDCMVDWRSAFDEFLHDEKRNKEQ